MFSIRRNPDGTVSITLSELCNLTRFQSRLLTIFKRHLGKREMALRNFLSDEMGDIVSKISWMERNEDGGTEQSQITSHNGYCWNLIL